MVMKMVDYLVDRYETGMTIERATLLLLEGMFPRRLIGENIHNVFQHAQTLNRWLTSKNPEPK